MSSEPESNLKSLYARALSLQTQLDTLQANTAQYTQTLHSALSAFEECQRLATSISLFSPNETLDDISTSDLPYLSLDYHLATLLPYTPTPTNSNPSAPTPPASRLPLLTLTQTSYARFLTLLDDYALLTPSSRALYARWSRDKDAFTLSPSDPTARREAKIARFRQEKELGAQLAALESASKVVNVDEDIVRRLRLKELELRTHRAFQALDLLGQERGLLGQERGLLGRAGEEGWGGGEMGGGRGVDGRERERRGDGYSERLDAGLRGPGRGGRGNGGPILSAKGKPLQPFTLLDRRQEVRDGVFRPGHNLPTMSIDEYLEAERARGGIIEGGGEPEEKVVDEDDLEAADRETMKQREWDEFVEANPRGSGNTLNRG